MKSAPYCQIFDMVPHLPLLQKLADLLVNLKMDWQLLDRSQAIVLGGVQSSPLHVVSGVPQGSACIWPSALPSLYWQIKYCIACNITMYADDIALWKTIRNPRDYTTLQDDITSICKWVADNHLILNLTKCCYIVFSRKHLPTMPSYIRFVCFAPLPELYLFSRKPENKLAYCTETDLQTLQFCTNYIKTLHLSGRTWNMLVLSGTLIFPIMDIMAHENTQKLALTICLKNWRVDYDLLLNQCHLPWLSSRRNFLELCLHALQHLHREGCISRFPTC